MNANYNSMKLENNLKKVKIKLIILLVDSPNNLKIIISNETRELSIIRMLMKTLKVFLKFSKQRIRYLNHNNLIFKSRILSTICDLIKKVKFFEK
jgi:hypothetical protein